MAALFWDSAIGDVVAQLLWRRGTKRRLVSSIGITLSFVPWEMKMRGLPRASTGVMTPGEKARICENRSPAPMTNDSAYDAPSECPAYRLAASVYRAAVPAFLAQRWVAREVCVRTVGAKHQ